MDIKLDRTDAEIEEQVKDWLKKYAMLMIMVLVLAIGLVFGINYYRQSQKDERYRMASQVTAIKKAIAAKQWDAALQMTQSLQQRSKDSSFSVVASLLLGKQYFEEKKYSQALAQYQWVIDNAEHAAMRDVARLRAVRTLANDNKTQAAQDMLSTLEGESSVVEGNLLKGDILLAAKQFDAAEKVYESIQNSAGVNADVIKERIDLARIKAQLNKNE